MGPIFFIMYISDLVDDIDHAGIPLYADTVFFILEGKILIMPVLDMNTAAAQINY